MEVVAALAVALFTVVAPPVQTQPAASATPRTVLFMCPHGAAKSLMASAYFQKIARERGLHVRVDSAGTEPDPALSKGVVAHLRNNGYVIPIDKPRAASAADMSAADIIISMGADLSKLPVPRGVVTNWNVPDFSANFDAAEQAIRDQVTRLVDQLLAHRSPK